jgi:hypothetical protein
LLWSPRHKLYSEVQVSRFAAKKHKPGLMSLMISALLSPRPV